MRAFDILSVVVVTKFFLQSGASSTSNLHSLISEGTNNIIRALRVGDESHPQEERGPSFSFESMAANLPVSAADEAAEAANAGITAAEPQTIDELEKKITQRKDEVISISDWIERLKPKNKHRMDEFQLLLSTLADSKHIKILLQRGGVSEDDQEKIISFYELLLSEHKNGILSQTGLMEDSFPYWDLRDYLY
ncbi:hypothetical protein KXD40_001378 [Peronospora effusa]|uniref:Uncharacterized protein n=1 Tax=Peronospora effusa TaxID=542832 RepID=A0A3M6VV77_9STRA|nr:hypothetical protein DD238_000266 [Peronospora effusa]RQM09015.1 hypothetical protein DD237_000477 [Peronospora effusa]UIZ20726.1 hypothetical protein KXD40_001378 [Peronospora effusa]CAI5704409.1 unnamed protein product [Peronospora effusa]